MRRAVAALAVCASLASAQSTSIDIDAISVPIPTTVFNLPVVYVTAENAPTVTATTLASTASAKSDPSATNVFDSAADVTAALSSASELAAATSTAAISKRAAASCIPQPSGINYNSSPDLAASFAADKYYANIASAANAVLPSGYTSSFVALNASNSADQYMGFSLLPTYDIQTCASKCSAVSGCNSFNVYFERDPSVNPDSDSCANPSSTIQIKCVFWGGAVTADNANNFGQWRNQFQVLIAGSNGYINTAYAAALASGKVPSNSIAPTSQETSAVSTYDIYSGYDSSVGAYSNAQASKSYQDCEIACDADSKCNAFTYVGGANGLGSGTCWLKQSLGKPTSGASNVVSGSKTGKLNVLTIVQAFYADVDVTSKVKAMKTGNNIVIDTTNLVSTFGIADPYQGQSKALSMIFSNGTATRVFVATDGSGKYTLAPAGSNSARNCVDTFVAPSTGTQVIAAVWGQAQNTIQSVYNNFNNLVASKANFYVGNDLFANSDNWYGTEKTGVVWYTSAGSIVGKAFKEYTTTHF